MFIFTSLFFFLLPTSSYAVGALFQQEVSHTSRGEVRFESRHFLKDDNLETEDAGVGLFSRLETRTSWGDFDLNFSGYGRVDHKDESRSFATLEDAYLSYRFGSAFEYGLKLGYQVFNWSVMDAFYPIDRINSRNFDSSPEQLEKMGELTVEFNMDVWDGDFSLYYFPSFQGPRLPSSSNRFGSGFNLYSARVVESDGVKSSRGADQFGLRLYQFIGGADIEFHYLNHIDRFNPIVGYHEFSEVPLVGIIPDNSDIIRPYFYRVQQSGLSLQKAFGPTVFKFEGLYRWYAESDEKVLIASSLDPNSIVQNSEFSNGPKDHGEMAFGFDYTYGLFSGHDLNILLEYSIILGLNRKERQQASIFQNDLFFGLRYSFNDINSKEILLTSIFDLERSEEFLLGLKYSQRLAEVWGIDLGLQWFNASGVEVGRQVGAGLDSLKNDQYFFLNITRYF